MKKHTDPEWRRAIWHRAFGWGAILFTQIIKGYEFAILIGVGGGVTVLDALRVIVYRLLDTELTFWRSKKRKKPLVYGPVRKWFASWFFPTLEFLHMIGEHGILRPREYRWFSSSGTFAAGILVAFPFFEIYHISMGIQILSYGDPKARERGHELGGAKMPYHDKKTKAGFVGFFMGAAFILFISNLLTCWSRFDIYPSSMNLGHILLMQLFAISVGAVAEVYAEKFKLNDNFAITPLAAAAAWAVSLIPFP